MGKEHCGGHQHWVKVLLTGHILQLGDNGFVWVEPEGFLQGLLPSQGGVAGTPDGKGLGWVHGTSKVLEHPARLPVALRLGLCETSTTTELGQYTTTELGQSLNF